MCVALSCPVGSSIVWGDFWSFQGLTSWFHVYESICSVNFCRRGRRLSFRQQWGISYAHLMFRERTLPESSRIGSQCQLTSTCSATGTDQRSIPGEANSVIAKIGPAALRVAMTSINQCKLNCTRSWITTQSLRTTDSEGQPFPKMAMQCFVLPCKLVSGGLEVGKQVEKGWPILLDGCWILIWRIFKAGIFRPASKRVTLSSGQVRHMVHIWRVSRLQEKSFSNVKFCWGKSLGTFLMSQTLLDNEMGSWVENCKFWILILHINMPWRGKAGNKGQLWLENQPDFIEDFVTSLMRVQLEDCQTQGMGDPKDKRILTMTFWWKVEALSDLGFWGYASSAVSNWSDGPHDALPIAQPVFH